MIDEPTQLHLNFDQQPGCVRCGKTKHERVEDFSGVILRQLDAVTWRCCVCDGLVCRDCTLCLPEGHPDKLVEAGFRQYYDDTYCSERCRLINSGELQMEGDEIPQ